MEQLTPLLFPLLLVVVFYLLVIRPARNRQRDVATLQSSLETGQVVMLTSGVYGELVHIGDDTVRLRVAVGTEITVHRQAVAKTVADADLERLRDEGSVVWGTH